jgi:hypothetical protein
MRRQLNVPSANTLVFLDNGPTYPFYEKSGERIIFPDAKKVIMSDNDKYFPDSWVSRKTFPNVDEIWISHVPGGFFDYVRDFPKFVTVESQAYRGYPKDKTVFVNSDGWREELYKHIPDDFFDTWGGINKKYTEYTHK